MLDPYSRATRLYIRSFDHGSDVVLSRVAMAIVAARVCIKLHSLTAFWLAVSTLTWWISISTVLLVLVYWG